MYMSCRVLCTQKLLKFSEVCFWFHSMHSTIYTKVLKIKVRVLCHVHLHLNIFIYIGVIELLSKVPACVPLLTTFLEGSHGVPVSLLASLFSPWYLLPPLPHHQKVLPIFCSTSFFDYNLDRMLPHHCRHQHCRRGPRACAGSKSTSYIRSS